MSREADSPRAQAPAPNPAPPPILALPGSHTLVYAVAAQRKGLSVQADAELVFQRDGTRYDARLTLKAWLAGQRVQTSRGLVDSQWGLIPERFGDRNRQKPEQAAHLEWTHPPPRVRFSSNAPDASLPPGSQDRLSALIQLAGWLHGLAQAGTPAQPGRVLQLPTVGTHELETWTFEVLGHATLDLPAGRMDTVHLRREPTHVHDNRVELWMAPGLHHLPVRVWWRQANGDEVDQQLARHTGP